MGSKHITPAEVKQFVKLYEEYGTYEAVAKKAKRSASAVSKHIKLYYAANLAERVSAEPKQIIINL